MRPRWTASLSTGCCTQRPQCLLHHCGFNSRQNPGNSGCTDPTTYLGGAFQRCLATSRRTDPYGKQAQTLLVLKPAAKWRLDPHAGLKSGKGCAHVPGTSRLNLEHLQSTFQSPCCQKSITVKT